MIKRIDLTEETYELPLTLIVDGKSADYTLTDVPLSAYKEFTKGGGDSDVAENIEKIERFALQILNTNKENVVFDKDILVELGTAKIRTLVQLYVEWLNDVLSSKN